jgi:hypothetical protein
VTGTAASATITWQPVVGGVSYSVKRWKQDDLRCCNNASSALGKPTWTDYGASEAGFTQAGIYVFEVTVVMEDRTTAASVVNWTRPEVAPAPVISREALTVKTVQTLSLAAPAGVTVRNDPSALVFSWQPVSGATGYQIDAAPAPEGPWTPLVSAPIAAAQFAYTPAPALLTYYRVSAALSLAVSANSTIVPFTYQAAPLNPLGVSAVQSGADVTLSWNPVAGASGYSMTALNGGTQLAQLRVMGPVTSATFAGLVTPGLLANVYGYVGLTRFLSFRVTAHFPPGNAPGADIPETGAATLVIGDPGICWPPAGELPGGPGQTIAPPVAQLDAVTLSWPMSGQVSAYRVDRAMAGSGQWQPLACIRPGSSTFFSSKSKSSTVTEFRDESIALQPSTSYQYRITAVGPPDATGKRSTNQSIVLATTAPRLSVIVGAVASLATSTTHWARLSWQSPMGNVRNYLITSSFGLRADMSRRDPPTTFQAAAPRGTHTFSVTPLYLNGTPAATTTVTVVVP